VSVIENEPAAVRLELTVTPFAVAVDVAVMVQTVAEVCTMPVIAEILLKVKSVPEAVDKVEQVMFSLPVTVNVIVAELEVAAERNRVTVGAVVSAVARVVKFRIEP
jgi:translation initiation factor 2B subunit (eIF-2B alpha/beta/delta family)